MSTPPRSPIQYIVEATPRRRKRAFDTSIQSPIDRQHGRPPWPRLGNRSLPDSTLIAATEEIFGYSPRPAQLRAAVKILEGHDVFIVAATGSGKSLVFALLAIAATLLGLKRVVIVICPLKALQLCALGHTVDH